MFLFYIKHCIICSSRFLKVPTVSNQVPAQPTVELQRNTSRNCRVTRASSEDIPRSRVTNENTPSLKRHVSWSDTKFKSNLTWEVVPNVEKKLSPDICLKRDKHPCYERIDELSNVSYR